MSFYLRLEACISAKLYVIPVGSRTDDTGEVNIMDDVLDGMNRLLFPRPEERPVDWESEEEEERPPEEDVGSEPDWDGEEETALPMRAVPAQEVPAAEVCWSQVHDYVPRPVRANPDLGRKRLHGKAAPSPPPQSVPPGYVAFCPEPLEDNRLARELGTPLVSVDWGSRKNKPTRLEPLEFETARSNAPPLFCVNAKEDGLSYYSAEPVAQSVTARQLLRAAKTVPEAYARMPLLRSPSRSVQLPEDFRATPGEDLRWGGVAVTDGQSEVSPAFAKKIGLLPKEAGPERPCLYSPWQLRGTIPTTEQTTCFAKAMLAVNLNQRHDMYLRKECRKVEWSSCTLARGGATRGQ